MRAKYLKATLRQDVGFFDTAGANVAEVVNSVGTDTLCVQDAVGEKVATAHSLIIILSRDVSVW
jgi:ATP-binding cassette subfamily B (MDR/TAP) protein 1